MGNFNFFNLFKPKEPEIRYDSWDDTWGKITKDDAFYDPERIGELSKKIDAMIAKGADINLPDSSGKTMLMYAAKEGNAGCVAALLDRFANFRVPDSKGRTALMMAAFYERSDVVDLLVDYCPLSAHVDRRDYKGRTALMYALRPFSKVQFGAFSANSKIVNKLFEGGAAVGSKDYKGRTALDYWEPYQSSGVQVDDQEAKKVLQKCQKESDAVSQVLQAAVVKENELSVLNADERAVTEKTNYSSVPQKQNVGISVSALKKGRD